MRLLINIFIFIVSGFACLVSINELMIQERESWWLLILPFASMLGTFFFQGQESRLRSKYRLPFEMSLSSGGFLVALSVVMTAIYYYSGFGAWDRGGQVAYVVAFSILQFLLIGLVTLAVQISDFLWDKEYKKKLSVHDNLKNSLNGYDSEFPLSVNHSLVSSSEMEISSAYKFILFIFMQSKGMGIKDPLLRLDAIINNSFAGISEKGVFIIKDRDDGVLATRTSRWLEKEGNSRLKTFFASVEEYIKSKKDIYLMLDPDDDLWFQKDTPIDIAPDINVILESYAKRGRKAKKE